MLFLSNIVAHVIYKNVFFIFPQSPDITVKLPFTGMLSVLLFSFLVFIIFTVYAKIETERSTKNCSPKFTDIKTQKEITCELIYLCNLYFI